MRTFALVFASVAFAGFFAASAEAKKPILVNCATGKSVQAGVNSAKPGDTVFIFGGTCAGDVNITTDDITLSGNKMGNACNKADPSASADATIDGTITVDGVRARIEHLEITGGGDGVVIVNRATVRLVCNDISDNQGNGVIVVRSSNAVLRDNTVSGNGQRKFNEPFIFFDCGLFAADASSVSSRGNTYENNAYCAIEADRQSSFRNGRFLIREPGHPADPAEKDVITQKAGANPVAIEAFNGGLVDLRNADVTGQINVTAVSSFRVDGETHIVGDIEATANAVVRIRNRNVQFGGDRQVTFDGTLNCSSGSQTYFSSVQCGQTCTGIIAGDAAPNTCLP